MGIFMSTNIFESTKIRSRVYHVTHISTGKQFELKGRPHVHHWLAYEISAKGKVSTYIYEEDWQSKKKLLESLDRRIASDLLKQGQKRADQAIKRKRTKELLEKRNAPKRFRPFNYAELKKKRISAFEFKYYAPQTQEMFTISKQSGVWSCRLNQAEQPIAIDMPELNDALLELYYYLDDALETHTRQEYHAKCFRKN